MNDVEKAVNSVDIRMKNFAYLRGALAELWADYTRLKCESAGLRHELRTHQARTRHFDELGTTARTFGTDGSREALLQDLSDRERQIADLHNSTSWRLTAPLRTLIIFLRR